MSIDNVALGLFVVGIRLSTSIKRVFVVKWGPIRIRIENFDFSEIKR